MYRRSLARMTNDVSPIIRTETIGELVIAEAQRGRVDDQLLQDLVDASQRAGHTRAAAEDLADSSLRLLGRRQPARAAELLACSIVLDLMAASDDDIPNSVFEVIARLTFVAVREGHRSFAPRLRSELARHLHSQALSILVDESLVAAREVLAERRSQSSLKRGD